jgi:hypothetical protein
MMKITEELVANIRSSMYEHLELLADAEAQRAYERNVPIADVPGELLCGWFDDVYHPEDQAFQAAFGPRELDALAEFNDLFTAAEAVLPEPLPPLCDLQAHPAWSRVISGAAKALRDLSGGAG